MAVGRIILYDQLHSASDIFASAQDDDYFVFIETADIFCQVKHHKLKLAYLIASYREYILSISKKYTNLEFNNPYYLTIHQFFVKKYLSFTTNYFDCINKDPDQLVEEIHLIEAKRSFNSIIILISIWELT